MLNLGLLATAAKNSDHNIPNDAKDLPNECAHSLLKEVEEENVEAKYDIEDTKARAESCSNPVLIGEFVDIATFKSCGFLEILEELIVG